MSKQVYLVPSNVLCVFGRAKCRAMTLIRVLPLLPLFLALGCSVDDPLGSGSIGSFCILNSDCMGSEECRQGVCQDKRLSPATEKLAKRVIGHLSGLIDSNEITLSLNNDESLSRTTNGDFVFINEVPADSTFGIVTVNVLPTNPFQECEVHMAESLSSSRTLNVEVSCACPRGYTQDGIGCITDTNPCNGTATLDDCNVCDGDGLSCAGCDNIPDSGLVNDACGVCDGDGLSCAGCDNIPNSGLVNDACGVCDGDGLSCAGCDNIPNSGLVNDACGVCDGDGLSCAGCDNIPNSGLVNDACGVCDGDNSSCVGCDNIPNSGLVNDACGVCDGDGLSCAGCDNIPNSGLVNDACGVCDGDGLSCAGCDNIPNSGLVDDACGVCDGDGSSCTPTTPPGMALIPAGDFWMGTGASGSAMGHLVTLDAFYMDITEVTAGDYKACVEGGGCTYTGNTMSGWRTYENGKDDHPINYVNWQDAVDYCTWTGKSLPTEAQWEKAARGGCDLWTPSCSSTSYSDQASCEVAGHNWTNCAVQTPIYPWGDTTATCTHAVLDDGVTTGSGSDTRGCGENSTWAVASKPDGNSPYGLYDMAGNVQEWTADWHSATYYSSSPDTNPENTTNTTGRRSLRGGAHNLSYGYLLAFYRYHLDPAIAYNAAGFRCSQ
jgi:formylglycine-generating enzyme required for sulfatase activity